MESSRLLRPTKFDTFTIKVARSILLAVLILSPEISRADQLGHPGKKAAVTDLTEEARTQIGNLFDAYCKAKKNHQVDSFLKEMALLRVSSHRYINEEARKAHYKKIGDDRAQFWRLLSAEISPEGVRSLAQFLKEYPLHSLSSLSVLNSIPTKCKIEIERYLIVDEAQRAVREKPESM